MLWMETLMIVGLMVAMVAVLALLFGPLGHETGSFEQDDDVHLVTDAWARVHNSKVTR